MNDQSIKPAAKRTHHANGAKQVSDYLRAKRQQRAEQGKTKLAPSTPMETYPTITITDAKPSEKARRHALLAWEIWFLMAILLYFAIISRNPSSAIVESSLDPPSTFGARTRLVLLPKENITLARKQASDHGNMTSHVTLLDDLKQCQAFTEQRGNTSVVLLPRNILQIIRFGKSCKDLKDVEEQIGKATSLVEGSLKLYAEFEQAYTSVDTAISNDLDQTQVQQKASCEHASSYKGALFGGQASSNECIAHNHRVQTLQRMRTFLKMPLDVDVGLVRRSADDFQRDLRNICQFIRDNISEECSSTDIRLDELSKVQDMFLKAARNANHPRDAEEFVQWFWSLGHK